MSPSQSSKWAREMLERSRRIDLPSAAEFQVLLSQVPEGQLPAKDIVSTLLRQQQVGFRCVGPTVPQFINLPTKASPEDQDALRVECFVLAATAEQAEEIAQAIVRLYDYGHSRIVHLSLPETIAQAEDSLAESETRLKENEPKLAELQKEREQLQEYKGITNEALADFLTQERLISVDLAGIQARIGACQGLLADGKNLNASRVNQIESLRITAEIEMVGAEARRRAIQEIREKGARYVTLSATIQSLVVQTSNDRKAVATYQQIIDAHTAALKEMKAFAKVSPIVIRRVQWEPEDAG